MLEEVTTDGRSFSVNRTLEFQRYPNTMMDEGSAGKRREPVGRPEFPRARGAVGLWCAEIPARFQHSSTGYSVLGFQ